MKKMMMIFVALGVLVAQMGCVAMEEERQQIPELEQSLEWQPTKKIEEATAKNRLIVENKAMGWSGPWRLHIKWYVRNHRAPRGFEEFDQILEYGERLLLGPIADVVTFAYAAHGQFWGKTSLKYQTVPRWVLDGWQTESEPRKDIIATITTNRKGASFELNHTFVNRPAMAGLQVAPSTGKLLDEFPTVKEKVLDEFTEDDLSRMSENQIEEKLEILQQKGVIQPRHFLGLPDGVVDPIIIQNVYVLKALRLKDLKNVRKGWNLRFIAKVKKYLQQAYTQMMV